RSQAEQTQPAGNQRAAGGRGTIAVGFSCPVGGRARPSGAPFLPLMPKVNARCLLPELRVSLLSFLFLFFVASLFGAVEKPFNFNETPGKLPKEVVPTEYAIRIVPNIDNFTFSGSETVKLNARSPVHQLLLNALDLKIEAVSVDR